MDGNDAILAAVMRSSLDAVVVINDDGMVVEFNPAAEAVFGYDRGSALGGAISEMIVPPNMRSAHAAGFARYLKSGEARVLGRRVQMEAMRSDGGLFPIELTITETFAGTRRLFVANIRDVSEVERARRELEVLQAQLLAFFNHTPAHMYMKQVDGSVVYCSPSLAATVGQTPEEVVGQTENVLLSLDRHAPVQEVDAELLATKKPVSAEMYHPLLKRHVYNSRFPILNEAGEITHVGEINFDIEDRVRAQQEADAARALFETFFDQAPLPMVLARPSGRLTKINRAMLAYHGAEEAELLAGEQHLFYDRWTDLRGSVVPLLEKVRLTKQPQVAEVGFMAASSELRTFSLSAFPVLGPNGDIALIGSIAYDLTPERQAEEQAIALKNQLLAFFNHAPVEMFLKEVAGPAVYCSPGLARAVGLGQEDVVGLMEAEFLDAGALAATQKIDTDIVATRTPFVAELYTPLLDRHTLTTRFPIMDAAGSVTHIGGIVVDIDERVRAQRALAESRALFSAFFDHIPVALTLRELDGDYVMLNRSTAKLYDASATDLLADQQRLVATPELAAVFAAADAAVIASERPHIEEHRLAFPAGVRDIVLARFPVRTRDGSITHIGGVMMDMTTQRRTEAELEDQRQALYQSEKLNALGSLLAGVSHELNNPLAVVVGEAIILEEDAGETEFAAAASRIRKAAERCAKIVQTFLAMARQNPPQRGPVDANKLVAGALELAAYGLRTAGVTVQRQLAAGLPPLHADADQLHQVVVNLVINAQQALQEHPQPRLLTISTRIGDAPGSVAIEIADNGPGVPPDIRQRIFEPFFTTKPQGVGTGVGLSFCRGIVDAHGGSLKLASGRGGGACFVLDLPAGFAEAAGVDAPVVAEPVAGTALVVDDEPELAETLARMLGRQGFVVDIAIGGEAAKRRLGDRAYDIILSDVRMPDLDGPALLAWIRAERPELADRIAFVTGDTLGPAAVRFLAEADRPYIEKPFTPASLRKLVEALHGRGR